MKLTLIFTFLILLFSCSQKKASDGATSPEQSDDGSSVIWGQLPASGQSLDIIVSGSRGKSFSSVSFFSNSTCSLAGRMNSGTSFQLSNGITLHLLNENSDNNIYYQIFDLSGQAENPCSLLFSYYHDNIAPSPPFYTPSGLLGQNNTVTKESTFVPLIGRSYIPSDSHGMNFYGTPSKSIVMGTILRDDPVDASINLSLNLGSRIYISFVDLAGNESSLYDSGVTVYNDSIAPPSPFVTGLSTVYTNNVTHSFSGTTSVDTAIIRVRALNWSNDYSRSTFLSGISIPLNANSANIFEVSAIDDVGNESARVTYTVIHDDVSPPTPYLSESSELLLQNDVKGPSNTIEIISVEEGTISLYSDFSLTTLVGAYSTDVWASGVLINFEDIDGANSFYAVAIDKAGNRSSPLTISFLADTTPPSSPVLSASTQLLSGSYVNTDSIQIQGSASLDTTAIMITGGSNPVVVTKSEFTIGISYELLKNQINTLSIQSLDNAGNLSSPVSLIITHDNIPPDFSVLYPLDLKTLKTSAIINGGCESLQVNILIGSNDYTAPCTSGVWNFQIPVSDSLSGSLAFSAQTHDLAGNISSVSRTVTIDNIAPVVNVDSSSLTTYSNNHNHLITGSCESNYLVSITGDFEGVVQCLGGFYIVPLSINTEGIKSFRASQYDYAGNYGYFDFSLEFDFTAPPKIILSQEIVDKNQTAVTGNTLLVSGIANEELPVKIYRDELLSNLVGVFTTAELLTGITVNLLPDRENAFYFVLEDLAGNLSTPAYFSIFQRLNLSKKYETIQNNISLSSSLGVGVNYLYKLKITNNSTDTNVNKRIPLEVLSFTSSTSEISVLPESECLQGPVVGFGECEIIISIIYNLPIGAKNNTITINYPDATTKDISVSHNVDTVLSGSYSLSISPIGSKLFSDHLIETKAGESFIMPQYYYDFRFEASSSTALGRARRVQSAGQNKIYLACYSDPTKLCSYDKVTSSLEEFMFPVNISALFSNYTASASPDVSIRYLGNASDTDYLLLSAHSNSNFTTQETYFIKYDVVAKSGTAIEINEGADNVSVQLPHSGGFLYGQYFYFYGLSSSGDALKRLNITTGLTEHLSDVLPNSGYFRVKNKIVFTDSSNLIVSFDLISQMPTIIDYVNEASNLKICKSGQYLSGKNFNIDERNEFEERGDHGLYLLCNASNQAKRIVYSDGVSHYVLEDTVAGTDQLAILNNQYIDSNRVLFSYMRTGASQVVHYYINNIGNVKNRYAQSYSGTYLPLAYFSKNQIFRQDQAKLVVEDLNFANQVILNTYSDNNWSLFSIRDTPFVLHYGQKIVSYYDTDTTTLLTYTNLASVMNSTIVFEGFYRGYLYLRNGTGGTQMFKVPLYSK